MKRCTNCKKEANFLTNCGQCGTYPLCEDCAPPGKHRAQGSMYRCAVRQQMKAKEHPVQKRCASLPRQSAPAQAE
jgi:hypothetical protein